MERIGVFCASSERMAPQYYESAEALGHWIGESGKTLVYGGANCGLMESVARSVKKAGGQVFGVVPRKLVSEGRVSDYIDITFHCNDLSDRKQWLIDESDIMIVLPGSVGTFDEAFCAMASNTFGMHGKKVVFWNIDGFYDLLFSFLDTLEGRGVLNKPLSSIMEKVETLDEIKEICGK